MTDVTARDSGSVMESVVIQGDLGKLTPEQRSAYYFKVCDSLGLNPLTKPFDYIMLNGKLTLYCRRDAADQLRRIHGINLTITGREKMDDLYIVTARATDRDGRQDESTGVVALAGLKGDMLANALMKAETKAKRRVTLSLVGLGWLDETEVETIPDAKVVDVDPPAIEAPKPHWIEDANIRGRFWKWTGETLGLTNAEVHGALGVQSMKDYPGTMQECRNMLMDWVNAQATPVAAE